MACEGLDFLAPETSSGGEGDYVPDESGMRAPDHDVGEPKAPGANPFQGSRGHRVHKELAVGATPALEQQAAADRKGAKGRKDKWKGAPGPQKGGQHKGQGKGKFGKGRKASEGKGKKRQTGCGTSGGLDEASEASGGPRRTARWPVSFNALKNVPAFVGRFNVVQAAPDNYASLDASGAVNV